MGQIIEYIVITLIFLAFAIGLYKGFLAIFFSWFSIFLGGILSIKFSYVFAKLLFPSMSGNIIVLFLIGITIFSITYMFIINFGKMFTDILNKIQVGALNYILGGIFGAAQMLILVGIGIYWINESNWANMHSYPISMFASFWAERIITSIGIQFPIITKIL